METVSSSFWCDSSSAAAAAVCLTAAVATTAVRGRTTCYLMSPKKKRSAFRCRKNKIKWYNRWTGMAVEKLELGKKIREGTADFIYGKPQDEDEYDDDEEFGNGE